MRSLLSDKTSTSTYEFQNSVVRGLLDLSL